MSMHIDPDIREPEPMGLESSFVQVFRGLFELSTRFKCVSTLPLLLFMGENLGEDNIFYFTPYRRALFFEASGVSGSSFTRALRELKEANLLWEEATNVYRLNPTYLWQGLDYKRNHLVMDIRASLNTEYKEPYQKPADETYSI